jgi:hypothetical protein
VNVLAKDCSRRKFRWMRLEYPLSNNVVAVDVVKDCMLDEVVVDALPN